MATEIRPDRNWRRVVCDHLGCDYHGPWRLNGNARALSDGFRHEHRGQLGLEPMERLGGRVPVQEVGR